MIHPSKLHHSYHLFRILISTIALLAILLGLLGSQQGAQAAGTYVLDSFTTVAYNNQNGTANWTSNWIETNDDLVATTGDVQITWGELRLNNFLNTASFESIERGLNIPVNAKATLTFSHRTQNLEAGDNLVLEVYDGDTAIWTTLRTFEGAVANASHLYDITAYQSVDTRIRFRITGGYTVNDEFFYADNVRIDFSAHTGTSILPTVQTYYVPISEDQVLQALVAIATGGPGTPPVSPTFVYISISVNSDDSVIYYDHWEDGYETSINDPAQATTEIWGDNTPANGIPPGYSTDILYGGNIIILNNSVPTGSLALIDFDGGDKLASTQAIAVTRTGWATGSGTRHAGSVEMLDTSIWGTRFDAPASATVSTDFEYTGLAVMASQNNTQIFKNSALVTTLNEGQSYLFSNTVSVGDKITASAPIQANLLTGDIGSNFESDWFTLYPYNLLGSSYYAPVNSEGGVTTAVFVQNPGTATITVNWETTAGGQPPLTVTAGGWQRANMPATATGARFYTSNGSVFQALSVINAGGQSNDWGYTLIPDNQLTQQAMVGWGVGRDPTSLTNPTENGSPVWVVAVGSGSMSVCADYNGDGLGSRIDNNGHRYDELLTLNNLQRAKVYDSDGDQTGLLLYLCNGSETGNVNKIAVAWGQDPATASAAAPGLDVGTTVPPLPNFTAVKGARLTMDINGDGKFDVGDSLEYQIRVNNVGALPIPQSTIVVADIIPTYTTYVPNSTRLDDVLIPDNGSGTPFPLDNGGYLIRKPLLIEGKFIITFQVQIDANLPGATPIQNRANISGLNLLYDPFLKIIVDPPSKLGDRVWLDMDGDGVQDAGEPGIPGVIVELSSGGCTPGTNCPTKVTDANGQYTFSGLADGTYTVIVRSASLPGGLAQTGDPDGCPGANCDHRHTVTLGPSSTHKPYWNADFGYQGNVSIGDFVWYDVNRNGGQDGGAEVGLDGVSINLTWAGLDGDLATLADNVTLNKTTDSSGQYNLAGLPAGTYKVDLDETSLPSNYSSTTTAPLTLNNLAAGTNIITADFGAASGAAVGDFVWNDLDNDGVQDAGESGLAGVFVYMDSNGNGVYDPGERNDTTDAAGSYLIPNLAPGTYSVRVNANSLPSGYTLTTANMPLSVTVAAGEVRSSADFGYRGSVLSISKSSSAATLANPGETITYNLLVRNNSAQMQTGISVRDTLPAGTTLVPSSTIASGYTPYSDDFSSGNYTGKGTDSINWGSNWTEVGEADGAGSGYLIVLGANTRCPDGVGNCFRIYAFSSVSLYREANLSTCSSATLTYAYRNFFSTTTTASVEVKTYTGNTLQRTLATYNKTNPGLSTASFSLTPAELANNFRISLGVNITGTDTNDRFYFDDVKLICAITRDNASGGANLDLINGNPPVLVKLEDGFALQPNQSMQVSFRVTVDSPAAQGLGSIDNTASVFSTQQLIAQSSSTSDLLSDYGDLPNSYGTLWASNGPRHTIGGLYLGGNLPDADLNGQPSADGGGDGADEDGIVRSSSGYWIPGTTRSLITTVHGSGGYLVGWFDWNNDGDFADAGEMARFGSVPNGTNPISLLIPAGYTAGQPLSARFRLYAGNPGTPSATGLVINGEVEDYYWVFSPTAVTLASLTAKAQPHWVVLDWTMADELDMLGFNVYRSTTTDGAKEMRNDSLLVAKHPGQMIGGEYQFTDAVSTGQYYFYWLEMVRINRSNLAGPVDLGTGYWFLLPTVRK